MRIINNIHYPVLDFIGDTVPWDNPLFRDIWTRLSPEETVRAMAEVPGFMKETSSFKNLPVTHALQQTPTAKRIAKWPLFSIPAEDFEALGRDGFIGLIDLVSKIWSAPAQGPSDTVEIVKGSLWDTIFYKSPEGFDEWLDTKEKNFSVKGTMLRPHEGIVEKFVILYTENALLEASMCFDGKECIWAHINFNGFLSSTINLPDSIGEIAGRRKCSEKQAFFQEDMYNILLYLFYKEHFMLKPRKVAKYEILTESEGYDSFRIVTDVPCIVCDGKNNS